MNRASSRRGTEESTDICIGEDILVVDDRPADLVAIESALEPLGRKLVFASSGTDALGKLLDHDFALILLEVAMPEISGIEAARLIRSRERSRGTPIIFVTGMSWYDEAIDEAYAAGGFDFLIKPIRAEVLRAKARVFLTLQERSRAVRHQAEELCEAQARLYEHALQEQRKRFESELLHSKLTHLADADRRQHEFAALIGNELLTPVQTLQMAFDLLRQRPNADREERIYSLVEHRLTHVTRLVESLIDIARVAAGQLALDPETVNVTEIVNQALDDCRSIIDARKLSARFDADASVAPLVMGDPARLLQALTTLIDHAARSTAECGQIVITSRVTAGDIAVNVASTGRGTTRKLLPKIFDVLGSDGISPGSGGLSLGLTLVKRLVELHDGVIRAASDGLGKGFTFEIRLPLAPQDVELSSLDSLAPQEMELSSPEPIAQDEAGFPIDLLTKPTVRMAALDPPPEPKCDDVA